MKILRQEKVIISTTHLDLHNDRMTKEALEDAATQISNNSIPVNWEHNPILPPVGRVTSASVERTKDGEYALVGLVEVFDLSSYSTILESGLEIPSTIPDTLDESLPASGSLDLELEYDPRNYPEEVIKTFCSNASGINVIDKQIIRKSVEPTSVILIALLGSAAYFFSKGFFTQLGKRSADEFISLYANFKTKLISLIKSRRRAKPTILILKYQHGQTKIEGAIQSEDDHDLENALDGFSELIAISKRFIELNPKVRLKSVQSIFDPEQCSWIFNYLQTESGEIIIGEHLAKNFRSKFETI